MNITKTIILSLCMMFGAVIPSMAQSPKEIHQRMHSRLLSNASHTIDKNAIQDYIKFELEGKEQAVASGFEGLSNESIELLGDLIQEAKTHMGKRYVYGSKGPNTFDCSGFTGYVYKQFGYNIGSCSRNQYTLGESINRDHLRTGDLVFFTSPRSGKGVGHVGIVVSADNEKGTFSFIHASITKGIRISESTEAYYVKRYIGAKRIINE